MKPRRGDRHRVVRWLWTSRRLDARLARLALLPAAGLWRTGMAARSLAYQRGWLAVQQLTLPTVAVGNLTVGGSGKAPLATWVARHYVRRGVRPAILTAGEEHAARVHRHQVPEALVLPASDPGSALGAVEAGAGVIVLEDGFRRLDLHRDLSIAVVSAETSRAVNWPIPAGPWREGWAALGRADALVVTRKRATREAALELAERLQALVQGPVAVADLGLREVEGLVSRRRLPAAVLAGRRVVAASGLADPDAFVAQVKGTGAAVQVATWKDHRDFRPEDVAWLAHASRRADHVVITPKDAAKLRDRWPANTPEPLVAVSELAWDAGGEAIEAALDAVIAR
jgi:tetraacyldisaccharide 4'-kinase